MTDLQIVEFMREHAAEIQMKADKGSPICKELLDVFDKLGSDPDSRNAAYWRGKLENAIREFQDFKSKGML